jgi:hypothetical protein
MPQVLVICLESRRIEVRCRTAAEAKVTEGHMSTPQLPDDAPWPAPPSEPPSTEADFAKMLYQAQIDAVKARYQAQIDEIKARWRDDASNATEGRKLDAAREDNVSSAEGRLREAVHNAYLEVAKSALDRSLQRANFSLPPLAQSPQLTQDCWRSFTPLAPRIRCQCGDSSLHSS